VCARGLSLRVGQGRAAETFGPDFVKLDKYLRALGVYRHAEASVAAQPAAAQKRLQAYADGVNAFLEAHNDALPPEFLLAGFRPDPWKPADSIASFKLLGLVVSHNQAALRAHIAQELGPDKVSWFLPGTKSSDPITTLPKLGDSHASADDFNDKIGALTGLGRGGSNAWVISGSRTVTGKPILANDPHLGLGAPIFWYLARIVTPDGWVKGATVPGAPIIFLGENDHAAWGFTAALSDVQDLYIETVDRSDPAKYLTPDGPKPFETREETILVKDGADVKLTVRTTRHGPVLSDISDDLASIAVPGKAIAMAFNGGANRDTSMEAFVRLDTMKSWDDFLAASRLVIGPTNIFYADTSGDIGFISAGLVPLRKSGDGLAPVDGASGAYDWVGTIAFDQLPQLHNPSVGFAFNANNAIVPDGHQPTFGQDWDESFRARRIQQFMDTIDKHSLETSAAMQVDHLSLAAKSLQPFIARIAPSGERAREAQAMLMKWNGVMDKDRPEPLIFTAFLSSLHGILIEDKTGLKMEVQGPFAATTLISLMTDHPSWCDAPEKPDPGCRRTLGKALDAGLALLVKRDGADMTQWRWGAEHVSLLQNKIYGAVPLLDRVSDLSSPSSGDLYTLDRGGGFDAPKDRPFARTLGAGFRGLYDLADPEKSRFTITTGQSGHIFSPHYRDFVPLWNDGKSITLTGSEYELKRAGARLLTLRP
jgi:penicillin G amidase